MWWTGLHAWAEAQYGYLQLEAIGASPFMWIVLISAAGLNLLTGLLPRRGVINLAAGTTFSLIVVALVAVNVAYGVDDGISPAGWLLAPLSLAQVLLFLGVLLVSGVAASPFGVLARGYRRARPARHCHLGYGFFQCAQS